MITERVAQLQQALEEYPRGESVHIPMYRALMDIDFFGGEEDRAPWSEIDSDCFFSSTVDWSE